MDRWVTNSPTVVAERAKIVRLWLQGATARAISQETGASLSTVYRWVRRWQQEGTVRARAFHKKPRKNPWFKGRENPGPDAAAVPQNSARTSSHETINEMQAFLTSPVPTQNRMSAMYPFITPPPTTNFYESIDLKQIYYPQLWHGYFNQYYPVLMHIYSELNNK